MANTLLPIEERNLTPDQVEQLDKRRDKEHPTHSRFSKRLAELFTDNLDQSLAHENQATFCRIFRDAPQKTSTA